MASVAAPAPNPTTGYQMTVTAGAHDRRWTPVTFTLPAAARNCRQLRAADGRTVPLQVDGHGQATFILAQLAHGTSTTYQLAGTDGASAPAGTTSASDGTPPHSQGVEVTHTGSVLRVTVDGRACLTYQAEPGELPRPGIKPIFRRGGYVSTVTSPAGKLVTDDYPPDHLHHHGIWTPWTKTQFEGRRPDFWNMGDGTGTVEFAGLEDVWSGPVCGGFRAHHRFIDLSAPQPRVALNETWDVTVYRLGAHGAGGAAPLTLQPYWMFDLVSTQECAGPSPLKLPRYHYGGLGFRGNRQWDGKDKAFFLTSTGETNRVKGNETRARWCSVGGLVDGEQAGITILGHPANFRAPQPMRLHPTEPFFSFAPSQLGDWAITPGHPYVARYRFIARDGAPDKTELERLWNDYADPPGVQVGPR